MQPSTQPHPTLGEATRFWLKLGFISFGGPAGQIAVMQEELVHRKRWISQDAFNHALGYCMVLPGPEAQQLATYVGWRMHGLAGAIIAGSLFVLPAAALLLALSAVYVLHGNVPAIAGLLWGLKPAVLALVLNACVKLAKSALKTPLHVGLAVASLLLVSVLQAPFPLLVLGAGVLGLLLRKGQNRQVQPGAAVEDHLRPSTRRAVSTLLGGLTLWAVPFAALWMTAGWDHVATAMARFFTQAALLTFGGAYAVLPYVFEASVHTHHWLLAPQVLDGMALGETTPGPLILVVTFIGFVGAWGTDHSLMTALLGGCVATYFTFLPSFVFILLGGPFVEATAGDLRMEAPLRAITATIVGVIASLLWTLLPAVLLPDGIHGGVSVASLGLLLVAAWLLVVRKVNVVALVLGAGLVGLLLTLLDAAAWRVQVW